ncbi:MAG: hypothetical protein AAF499_17270 [Pseudomonadota bacterium]
MTHSADRLHQSAKQILDSLEDGQPASRDAGLQVDLVQPQINSVSSLIASERRRAQYMSPDWQQLDKAEALLGEAQAKVDALRSPDTGATA